MRALRLVAVCLACALVASCPAAIRLDWIERAQDTLGPTIVITSPADRSVYRSTVTVIGTATDPAGGADPGVVASLAWSLEGAGLGGDLEVDADGLFSFTFSTQDLTGDLVVQVDGVDWNGNTLGVALTLLDDGIGPYLAISTPADQSYYSKTVLVTGEVRNREGESGQVDEVRELRYEILGTTLPEGILFGEDGSFAFEFSTVGFSGPRTVSVTAVDWQGHESTEIVTLLSAGNDVPSFTAAPGSGRVTLSWDPVPFAGSYVLYNLRYGEIAQGPTVTSPFAWTGLSNGTLYSFQLQAVTLPGHGEDNWSARLDVIPLSTNTLAPRVAGMYRELSITWPAIPAADEYVVHRALAREGPFQIRAITNQTSLQDVEVDLGQTYYYRVLPMSDREEILSGVGAGAPSAFPTELYPVMGTCDLGYPTDMVVSEGKVYVASSGYLEVVDLADPARPLVTDRCLIPDGAAVGVAVSGDYAYVAAAFGGLQVVRVSGPGAPAAVASLPTTYDAYGVAIAGDYAYVVCWGSLEVVDITDPTSPGSVASCWAPISNAIARSGSYLYVAGGVDGLLVYSLADPELPDLVGGCATNEAVGLAVSGDYVYLADLESGLRVISIATPEAPSIVGTLDTAGLPLKVAVDGDTAFVVESTGLRVVDVSNPAAPAEILWKPLPGGCRTVAVSTGQVYVADNSVGLRVMDRTAPTAPAVAGSTTASGSPTDLVVSGDIAYVVAWADGLRVFDVADVSHPASMGFVDTPGAAGGVDVSGGYVYVADGTAGVQVVDVSDPYQPVIVGTVDTPGTASDIAVWGDYAYVADQNTGLQVIDVSNPTAPVVVGFLDTGGGAAVVVDGSYAYVAAEGAGLRIADISDPAHPVLKNSCVVSSAVDVAVSGGLAYIATYGTGLTVVDVSDLESPLAVTGTIDTSYACGVAVSGIFAFVADYDAGLLAIDLADPVSPAIIGVCDTGRAKGVCVRGDYAYIADGITGLSIVDLLPP